MMTSKIGQLDLPRHRLALLALVLGGIGAFTAQASVIQEPAAVFYGKVTGTGSDQPFVVTDGQMQWSVRRADGTSLVLKSRLWPQKDGEFSYRLDVPQEALVQGLTVSAEALPLKTFEETHAIVEILVDGVRARIAGPDGATFDADQLRRAATHRLDLEVPLVAPDGDGDGLPDWWEAKQGGDLTPGGDADGDGLTNLEEYRAGTDPLRDSRRPVLATTALQAYADATSGVFLRVLDSDTPPEALVFTLTRAPVGAELRLRNARPDPQHPDLVLQAGASFRQSDVLAGRLVLVHSSPTVEPCSFEVTVGDGAPEHLGAPAAVSAEFYRPSAELVAALSNASGADVTTPLSGGLELTSAEMSRVRDYLRGRDLGAVLRDGAAETGGLVLSAPSAGFAAEDYARDYLAKYGADRPQVFRGGKGNDTLSGGMADDVLSGGAGENRLTGGGGRDRFAVLGTESGTDTITDFRPAEGDVLDLTDCLHGSSPNLRDYVRLTVETGGVRLDLDQNGDGSGFTDRTIKLTGLEAADADLYALVGQGSLSVGTLVLPPRIAVAASIPDAAENGPRKGEFLLTRSGEAGSALTVHFSIRGAAVNGVDFATVAGSTSLAAGQREARIAIEPYADNQAEPAETVELSVEPGDGYEMAPAARAVVTIADLLPVVRIEAVEALATFRPVTAGAFLVTRDTVVDRSLLVRLDFRGNGVNGADYQSVSRFLNLAPGQTTALISIQPTAAAASAETAKSVRVALVADAAYLVAAGGQAEVLLVPERMNFATWRGRYFASTPGTAAAFGAADTGGTGISNARRYAFGMDPLQPDRARLPKAVMRDGHLTLDVWRRPGAEDLEFVAEVSTDLVSWSGSPDQVERVVLPEHGGNPEIITFRAVTAREAGPLFMNLRVVLRP